MTHILKKLISLLIILSFSCQSIGVDYTLYALRGSTSSPPLESIRLRSGFVPSTSRGEPSRAKSRGYPLSKNTLRPVATKLAGANRARLAEPTSLSSHNTSSLFVEHAYYFATENGPQAHITKNNFSGNNMPVLFVGALLVIAVMIGFTCFQPPISYLIAITSYTGVFAYFSLVKQRLKDKIPQGILEEIVASFSVWRVHDVTRFSKTDKAKILIALSAGFATMAITTRSFLWPAAWFAITSLRTYGADQLSHRVAEHVLHYNRFGKIKINFVRSAKLSNALFFTGLALPLMYCVKGVSEYLIHDAGWGDFLSIIIPDSVAAVGINSYVLFEFLFVGTIGGVFAFHQRMLRGYTPRSSLQEFFVNAYVATIIPSFVFGAKVSDPAARMLFLITRKIIIEINAGIVDYHNQVKRIKKMKENEENAASRAAIFAPRTGSAGGESKILSNDTLPELPRISFEQFRKRESALNKTETNFGDLDTALVYIKNMIGKTPSNRPVIILLDGMPNAGKTTLLELIMRGKTRLDANDIIPVRDTLFHGAFGNISKNDYKHTQSYNLKYMELLLDDAPLILSRRPPYQQYLAYYMNRHLRELIDLEKKRIILWDEVASEDYFSTAFGYRDKLDTPVRVICLTLGIGSESEARTARVSFWDWGIVDTTEIAVSRAIKEVSFLNNPTVGFEQELQRVLDILRKENLVSNTAVIDSVRLALQEEFANAQKQSKGMVLGPAESAHDRDMQGVSAEQRNRRKQGMAFVTKTHSNIQIVNFNELPSFLQSRFIEMLADERYDGSIMKARDYIDNILGYFIGKSYQVLVAFMDNKPVGYALIKIIMYDNSFWVSDIYVAESKRRLGIAAVLWGEISVIHSKLNNGNFIYTSSLSDSGANFINSIQGQENVLFTKSGDYTIRNIMITESLANDMLSPMDGRTQSPSISHIRPNASPKPLPLSRKNTLAINQAA